MPSFLEFEKPIAELEGKIAELRHLSTHNDVNIIDEISHLQVKVDKLLKQTYSKLNSWQKTLIARHPERPHFFDYIQNIFTDFIPLAGDRCFADDKAIIGGLAKFNQKTVMVIGHEKGSDTASRVKHNFGMAKPEGYRKTQRLMKLADHFGLPIVTLVDTPGAYPGIDAEARGQAEAIAKSIQICLEVKVPLISVIIGEGGSGGAVALAVGNKVLMLEHSVYSVISPEGCASILWRSASHAKEAAEALKLTAADLLQLGVIDTIIKEPLGGAHRDQEETIQTVKKAIEKAFDELIEEKIEDFVQHRVDKFLDMGQKN
ncbi:MAG: acetyl-CoA carboxylase carboxyltransferase subunit alpha [Alphaproteobacteria bacterium]|nr:acetyl-CoA carboxylase carboxyltransferase subunit alpha [Alphaproteobacteria bacterium]